MNQPAHSPEPFVPFEPALQPGTPPDPGSRLKVVSTVPDQGEFSPLSPRPAGIAAHGNGHGLAGSGAPTITLQREGDRVIGIRVECTCGQVIELACS